MITLNMYTFAGLLYFLIDKPNNGSISSIWLVGTVIVSTILILVNEMLKAMSWIF